MPRTVFNKYIHTLEVLQKAEKEHGATKAGEQFDISYMSFTRWKKKVLSFKHNEFKGIDKLPNAKHFVYVIRTNTDCYYVGSTVDLNIRLTEHQNNIKYFDGSYKYHKDDYPLTIIHVEWFNTQEEAKNREVDWILYYWYNIDHSKLKNERIKGKSNNVQHESKKKTESKPPKITDPPSPRKKKKKVESITISQCLELAKNKLIIDPQNSEFITFVDRASPGERDQYLVRTALSLANEINESRS